MADLRCYCTLVVMVLAVAAADVDAAQPPVRCEPPSAIVVEALPAPVRTSFSTLSAAVAARPSDADAAGRLGMLFHAYDQYEAAGRCYERAGTLAPTIFAWAYLAAVARSEISQSGATVAALRRARHLDGSSLAARLRLAEALLVSGDLAGSFEEYTSILSTYPELALAHYGIARVLENQGKKRQAVSAYEAAINFAPEFGPAHYALALAYRDAGRSALAVEQMAIFRRVGTRRPGFPDPLMDDVRSMRSTARDLITRAVESAHAGRLDDAIALHLEALASDPRAAQAHVNLISLYGRTGRAELAEQHYRDALLLGSDLADAHYNFGVLMASRGRTADASSAFRRALEVDPFHPRAHNNLGALLAREGRASEALEHYRQALASDPQYAAARFALGRVLVELGRPTDAAAEFQRLVGLPESAATPGYTFALASALYASGSVPEAIRYAEEAQRAAQRYQQEELARSIARELAMMQARRRD